MYPTFFRSLVIFLLIATPLIFLGYGSDGDAYGVLRAGTSTWENAMPQTSRHPGYWLYEALVFGLSQLGGYILMNGATLFASAIVLYRFHSIAISEKISNPTLLTLCLALNPWFLIAATSTMDYIWALLFIVWSIELTTRGRYIAGGLASGMAAGFRLGSVFPLAFAFLSDMLNKGLKNTFKHYFKTGLVACVVISVFYFPSWLHEGQSFSFLQGHLGDESLWTLKMHAGRFFYKTIYLFGLPAFMVVLVTVILCVFYNAEKRVISQKIIMSFGACLGTLFLYARYPIEISYLLPFLFFFLLILGFYLGEKGRIPLAFLLTTTILYSIVSLPFAQPNVPNKASDARFGLSVERGVLLKDISARLKLIRCGSAECYQNN